MQRFALRFVLITASAAMLVMLTLPLIGIAACASCENVSTKSTKLVLIAAGTVLLIVLSYFTAKKLERQFAWTAGMAAVGSLAFLAYMAATKDLCPYCAGFHASTIFLALSSIRTSVVRLIAPVSVVLIGSMVFAASASKQPESSFTPRVWESLAEPGSKYVIFTDPECPHCHEVVKETLGKPGLDRDRLFFRWFILNRGSDRKIRAAAVCESLWSVKKAQGDAFLLLLSQIHGPLTSEALKRAAKAAQSQERPWIMAGSVPPELLTQIALDGQVAKQLNLTAVPAVFELSKSDSSAWRWKRIDPNRLSTLLRNDKVPVKEETS